MHQIADETLAIFDLQLIFISPRHSVSWDYDNDDKGDKDDIGDNNDNDDKGDKDDNDDDSELQVSF